MKTTEDQNGASLKRVVRRRRIGRWESACLNLNTARNDWMDATNAALDGNRAECVRAINECVRQLMSAKRKVMLSRPPKK